MVVQDDYIFYLDAPSGQSVMPGELDAWLEELETAVPGVEANVIIEACHSVVPSIHHRS